MPPKKATFLTGHRNIKNVIRSEHFEHMKVGRGYLQQRPFVFFFNVRKISEIQALDGKK